MTMLEQLRSWGACKKAGGEIWNQRSIRVFTTTLDLTIALPEKRGDHEISIRGQEQLGHEVSDGMESLRVPHRTSLCLLTSVA